MESGTGLDRADQMGWRVERAVVDDSHSSLSRATCSSLLSLLALSFYSKSLKSRSLVDGASTVT